jgi:rhodanese-related sulfurtransferase/predicted transcriptional regulator
MSRTSSSSTLKTALYREIARVAAALASDARLQLLEYIAQGERSVETLAAMAGLSMANCSKHLQTLRTAGLVCARKDGVRVYYALAGDDVVALYSALQQVAETRVAEVDNLVRTWLKHRDEMEPVTSAELIERCKLGLVIVIDVRPPEEFAAGHLPGAINVPIDELESRLVKFSKRKELIAYCRGPYCVMSFDAVRTLRDRGLKARRLEGGFPEWRSAGLPVER